MKGNVKWLLCLEAVFHKAAETSVSTIPPIFFYTDVNSATDSSSILFQTKVILRQLWKQIDQFEKNGSGWVLSYFISLCVNLISFNPLRANSYISLPPHIKNLKAIINIKNERDNHW